MAEWSGCWTLSRVHRTQHWEKQQAELGASYNVWQNGQAVGLYHGYIALNTWHKQQAEIRDSELVTCERIVRLLAGAKAKKYFEILLIMVLGGHRTQHLVRAASTGRRELVCNSVAHDGPLIQSNSCGSSVTRYMLTISSLCLLLVPGDRVQQPHHSVIRYMRGTI